MCFGVGRTAEGKAGVMWKVLEAVKRRYGIGRSGIERRGGVGWMNIGSLSPVVSPGNSVVRLQDQDGRSLTGAMKCK